MKTTQSKKHKKFSQKLVFKPVEREPDVINIHRKSPIRNNNLRRYFFRRVNVAAPGMQKKYQYFPKPQYADIIQRANFLNANGYYKHQKVKN